MRLVLKWSARLAAVIGIAVFVFIGTVLLRYDRAHDVALPDITVSTDPEVISRGEYLVHGPGHCSLCHSAPDDATATAPGDKPTLKGGFFFAMPGFGTFRPPNLTPDPATGIGLRTPGELARTIRNGLHADGSLAIFMTIHANGAADDDLQAMVSYLMSTAPVVHDAGEDELGFIAKALQAFAFQPAMPTTMKTAPPMAPTVERGKYLAESVALCVFCHTKHDPVTMEEISPPFSGGEPYPALDHPEMEFTKPNITPHPSGVLARYDEEAFLARFRAGRLIPNSPMPWQTFGNMTDDDLRAIYRFLQTVPPIENDTGPSYRKTGWQPGD